MIPEGASLEDVTLADAIEALGKNTVGHDWRKELASQFIGNLLQDQERRIENLEEIVRAVLNQSGGRGEYMRGLRDRAHAPELNGPVDRADR